MLPTRDFKRAIFLRQGSKVNWLKDKDKSTKKFHKVAMARKCLNNIFGLLINDIWTQDSGCIKEVRLLSPSKG